MISINPVVITNNKTVINNVSYNSVAVDGDPNEVLLRVRDLTHSGSKLLSYPLGASIKMLHSPVLSVLIDRQVGDVDLASVEAIESSILKLKTTIGERPFDYTDQEGYELIDYDRLKSAMKELNLRI